MKRKLMTFGIGVLAALAMSGVSTNAASAVEFHSEGTETTVTGTSTGSHVVDFAGFSLVCKKATLTGTQAAKTAQTLTMSAAYSECTFLFFNVNVNMNGCDYVFNANGEVSVAGGEACKGITFEGAGCKVNIGAQTGLKSVGYTNTSAGASRNVDVAPAVTGFSYTSSGLCPKNGSFSDGNYTTGATNLKGNKGGVWVE